VEDLPGEGRVDLVAGVRAACLGLPEIEEQEAWVGTRWRVRGRTFAHLLTVDGGWPPTYARVLGTDGPVTLLMFRSAGPELDVLREGGPPFFGPPWRSDEVGMVVEGEPDWDEVRELLTESYCAVAPKRLAAAVVRP
jgi:hypothetical protein